MNILVVTPLNKCNKINTIKIVNAELTNRYIDEFLTLFVTVKMFHKGSSGRLKQSPSTEVQVR